MMTRVKMMGCLLLLWCAAPLIDLENAVAQENPAAEEAPAASTPPAATEKPRFAGPSEQGFLLPNGWTLTPAGEHLQLNDLPLNIIALPDGEHVLVSTNGYNAHELSLVNLASKQVVSKQANFQSWFGLAVNAAAKGVSLKIRTLKTARTGDRAVMAAPHSPAGPLTSPFPNR